MAKQRKHQGLRADGKLRKGFKYSGKRNKNGTARIVKVVQKKKMKGGNNQGLCRMQRGIDIENANTEFHKNKHPKKLGRHGANEVLQDRCHNIKYKDLYCAKVRNFKCKLRNKPLTTPAEMEQEGK